MKVRVFTLLFDAALGGFDDGQFRSFVDAVEVVDVQHHFFTHGQQPWLLMVVRYQSPVTKSLPANGDWRTARSAESAPDDAGTLDEVQRRRFDALRVWRNGRARTDGIPPYSILTNRQLAAIVRLEAPTKDVLGRVDGFGERRRASYGDDVLAVLAAAMHDLPATPDEGAAP